MAYTQQGSLSGALARAQGDAAQKAHVVRWAIIQEWLLAPPAHRPILEKVARRVAGALNHDPSFFDPRYQVIATDLDSHHAQFNMGWKRFQRGEDAPLDAGSHLYRGWYKAWLAAEWRK